MALPANALLTLAEAKEHLRIKSADTQNDSWIETLIGEAADWMEGELDRPLRYQPKLSDDLVVVAQPWLAGPVTFLPAAFVPGARLRFKGDAAATGSLAIVGDIDGSPVNATLTVVAGAGDCSTMFDALTSITATVSAGAGNFDLSQLVPGIEYHTIEAPGYAGFGPILSNVPGESIEGGRALFHSRLRPIIRLVEVSEDPTQVYGTKLTRNLDFVFSSQGRFSRLNTKGLFPFGAPSFPEDWGSRFGGKNAGLWAPGLRAVRLVYAGGFDTVADVPSRFKNWAGTVVLAYYRGRERKDEDLTSKGDSAGSYSKAETLAKVSEQMKAQSELTYSVTFEEA